VTDSNPVQRRRQAMLGCAPAHGLFALVDIKLRKEDGIETPRRFGDYEVTVARDRLPAGVTLLEMW
jgi:CRISPR-associated protein Csd2